jgi:hypothetical protein
MIDRPAVIPKKRMVELEIKEVVKVERCASAASAGDLPMLIDRERIPIRIASADIVS